MNADALYDPMKHNVASEVRRETGGRGVDLAIVASGNPKAIVQGLKSIRKGGRLCLFGVPSKGSELDYDVSDLLTNEISITSSNAATEKDTREALKLIGSRKIDVRSMVTHRFGLGDFAKAVRVSSHAECIKCIITP
jgi:L-iditol 2-dehydrogenase